MPDKLTVAALRGLEDLKRRALLQHPCPDCNDHPCHCEPAHTLPTRTYRPACHGYANGCTCGACPRATTLHVITTTPKTTKAPVIRDATDCDEDPMTCDCTAHRQERARLVRRGVRTTGHQPWEPRTGRRAA